MFPMKSLQSSEPPDRAKDEINHRGRIVDVIEIAHIACEMAHLAAPALVPSAKVGQAVRHVARSAGLPCGPCMNDQSATSHHYEFHTPPLEGRQA